jgi:hypothetical protein
MTRSRTVTFAFVAVALAAFLFGGTGWVSGMFGPRVMLDASGQLGTRDAAPAPKTEPGAAPAKLPTSGAAGAAARVFTSVSAAPAAREAKGYTLEARIVGKDGKAQVGVEVGFYDRRELLGPREMLVGVVKTDGYGVASIDYLPAEGGTHTIAARPTQWDRLAATEATTSLQAVRVAPSTYARERLPLDGFSPRLPYAAAAVLFAILGLFAFVVLGTAFVIPRGARSTPYMGRAREI